MAFMNNAYANIGSEVKEGSARIWTSYKKDGEYKNDFSGFVTFVGKAAEKAAELAKGDRIQLKAVSVANSYNKETGETRYYCKVLDFEKVEKKSAESDDMPDEE